MLQGSGGNIGLSIGDDGTLMVDDQFAPLTQKIQAAVTALTRNPVDFVINTHWHYDHTDGNTNFGRAGAILVAHENARTRMTRTDTVFAEQPRPRSVRARRSPEDHVLPVHALPLQRERHRRDPPAAAHTDGDAAVYFRDTNVLHTGDTFTRGALPFIDRRTVGLSTASSKRPGRWRA